MTPSLSRQQELASAVNGVLARFLVNKPMAAIMAELEATSFGVDEQSWILAEAQRRLEVHKSSRRKEDQVFLWTGGGLMFLGIFPLVLFANRMPSFRFGQAVVAAIIGFGLICYGLYCQRKPLG